MSNQTGASRPRNPDGTVNWSVVFDDPDRGILAAIDKATSIRHLSGLVSQIGPLLFQRRNDAKDLAAFNERMQGIIEAGTDADFEAVQSSLRDVLVAEKLTRIRKAEEYVENKRRGQSIDRRNSGWSFDLKKMLFGTPLRMFSVLAFVFVMISLGVLSQIDFSAKEPTGEETAEKKYT